MREVNSEKTTVNWNIVAMLPCSLFPVPYSLEVTS